MGMFWVQGTTYACIISSIPLPWEGSTLYTHNGMVSRREEVVEQRQWALVRLEQVKRRAMGPEMVKMQALIQRCNTELEEMSLIEQYRKDENYEPALHVEHHS